MEGIDQKYIDASYILEDVWNMMDWEGMNQSRKRGIQDEYLSKIRAYSRCYGDINRFLDRICKSFGSKITKKTIENLKNTNEIMEIFREETQIPIVLFQIRKQEKKNNNQTTLLS